MRRIGIFSLIVFVLLSILLVTNNIIWFDNTIYNTIINQNDFLTIILKNITELGDFIILISISLLLLLVCKQKKIGILVCLNLALSFVINEIFKIIFIRPRPIDNILISVNGYSFPSGHSMVSMSFYGLLIYLCYKNINNKIIKWLLIIFQVIIILIIGYSRIYLGAHFPSDVIAGFSLGLFYLILYINLVIKRVN